MTYSLYSKIAPLHLARIGFLKVLKTNQIKLNDKLSAAGIRIVARKTLVFVTAAFVILFDMILSCITTIITFILVTLEENNFSHPRVPSGGRGQWTAIYLGDIYRPRSGCAG